MRTRRDFKYGKDLTPDEIWDRYRSETFRIVHRVITAARPRLESLLEPTAELK